MSDKSAFIDIRFNHWYLPVAFCKINCSEISVICLFLKNIGNVNHRFWIKNGDLIKLSIIHTQARRNIFLEYKHYMRKANQMVVGRMILFSSMASKSWFNASRMLKGTAYGFDRRGLSQVNVILCSCRFIQSGKIKSNQKN